MEVLDDQSYFSVSKAALCLSACRGREMKKYGLFTFSCADNFGAVLQNYALESWIREKCTGIDIETISYVSPDIHNVYLPKLRIPPCNSIPAAIKFVPRLLRRLYILRLIKQRGYKFDSFKKVNLKLSCLYDRKEALQNVSAKYDCLLTGSDQVLNPKITKDDWDVYSLAMFDGCQKLGYAVSSGSTENLTPGIVESLENFRSLSARESDFADVLSLKLGRDVPHVVDPVFLKTREEWERVALTSSGLRKVKGDYIFTYMANREARTFAKWLARKEHLKVVSIDYCLPIIEGAVYAGDCGPAEFIRCLADAKYVVTSSFHATAFSIIFHKKLFCFANKSGRNRIDSIMAPLGLSRLVFCSAGDVGKDSCPVDWDDVDAKLSLLREKSQAWLKSALEGVVDDKD